MKVLIVGYGSAGKRHIENLSKFPNIDILVYTKRKYDNFLKQKKCKKIDSLKKCLEIKPDAAIICNVTNLHVKTALKLAEFNIHLFIEKPLSNSLNNVHYLQKIIKQKKLITHVGCVMRFHPCLQKIKKILDTKKLGKIMSVQVQNGSFLPDWHPYENYKKNYAARKDLGGGVVLTCIHEIDYLNWFFHKVKEVNSFLGKVSNLGITGEDLASFLLRFQSNMVAEVHLDYFQKPAERNGKIIGTNGKLIWDFTTNSVKLYDIDKKRWIEILKSHRFNKNKMYQDELNYFINCINDKKESFNNITKASKVLEIALAVKESDKYKKVIKV